MKFQLLLLVVALAGPFCAFTLASPTATPLDDTEAASEVEVFTAVQDGLTVITGAPEKTPTIMPAVLETEGATVEPAPEGIETTVVMNKEEDAISEIPVAASTAAPIEFITERHAVVTAAPAAPAAPTEEARAEVTTAADAKPENEVVIEEGTDEASEGLSSGQVAGIVIGALLALVIVIAVVIAAIRRMGKYSP